MIYTASKHIIKPQPGCVIDWSHPLSRGLVGCWLFNEGAGSKVLDIAGRNHGTLTNMSAEDWVGSPHGGSLDFDGTDDCIPVNFINGLLDVSNYSIGVWFFKFSTATQNIINFSNSSTNRHGIDFASSSVRAAYYNGAYTAASSDASVILNKWHHVLFLNDLGVVRMFLNGVLQSGTAAPGLGTGAGSNSICSRTSSVGFFGGRIGQVTIHLRTLNRNDAATLYTDPYANILAPATRRWFLPAGGGGGIIAFGDGASSGVGTASGSGASTAASNGAAVGSASVSGAASITTAASAASSGSGTACAEGASVVSGTGAASGSSAVAGESAGTGSATGTASGTGSASASGALTIAADGCAAGGATVTGKITGDDVFGSAVGTSTCTAVGEAIPRTADFVPPPATAPKKKARLAPLCEPTEGAWLVHAAGQSIYTESKFGTLTVRTFATPGLVTVRTACFRPQLPAPTVHSPLHDSDAVIV